MTTPIDQSDPSKGDSAARPRRAWVALLLSLIAAGLGQLYNGQWRKGLLLFGLELALGLALFVGLRTFPGMVLNLAALVALNIYAILDTVVVARHSRDFRPGPCNRVWIYLLAAVVALGAGNGLEYALKLKLKAYKAPSGSMIPTLVVGDHFMVEKLPSDGAIRRGDVVIFLEHRSGKHFVKRVIGLPGETVAMRARKVLVDGRELDEPYVNLPSASAIAARDFMAPVRLAPGRYLLLGDNRDHSYDSRWLGPVDRADILGRALYLYLPGTPKHGDRFDRLGQAVR